MKTLSNPTKQQKDTSWRDKKFIRINHRAIDDGLFQLKGSVLKVFLVRLLLADNDGYCNFSTYWVAKKTGQTIATVIKAETKLENLGWFIFDRQIKDGKKRRAKNGRWAKNTCKINLRTLPNYLRGVFRDKKDDQTVDKNYATEKVSSISLNEILLGAFSKNALQHFKPNNNYERIAYEAWQEIAPNNPGTLITFLKLSKKFSDADIPPNDWEYKKDAALSLEGVKDRAAFFVHLSYQELKKHGVGEKWQDEDR